MDPEIIDKSNNCETEESPTDSSLVNKNSVLKEGVKKGLGVNSVNEDECTMEVDKEEDLPSNDICSEKKNGVFDDSSNSENQKTDTESNGEKVAPNHEQNNVDKDLSSASSNAKDSESAMDCEPSQDKKGDEPEQNAEISEHIEDHKKESESNGQPSDGEKPTEVNALNNKDSSEKENSPVPSEKDSKKDDVRPVEKDSNVSSESVGSESPVAKSSSKTDSSDKETKDSSTSEVTNEAANIKENKGKEANGGTPTETKTESTKKEGEHKKKKSKTCEECGVKKGLKFQVLFKGKTRFLCSDTCFKNFKSKQMQPKPAVEAPAASSPAAEKSPDKCAQCQKDFSGDQKFYPVVGEIKVLCSEDCMKKYHAENMPVKSCSQCKKNIESPPNPDTLTWETMVFCNEDCLGKYQSYLGSHCTCCQSPVPQASLGKYSVCFGADIRQFCSCSCLDDFKKNLKVCSFCQTDLSAGVDNFLAPVGDKGQFKDFCSPNCMERYEVMNNISKNAPQTQVCSHCKKQGTFKIQVKHDNQTFALCGDVCVAGFRCSHKIKDKMCYTCYNFFNMAADKDKDFSFKFDGQFKQFCTKACMTLFVLSHRRIVACASCKVKKYNFDMIEKLDSNNQPQIFCSLNCLSLYRVSVNATSSKCVRCDNCTKNLPAQYHLTMSDGSVRNFCTYNCVMVFQNQYTNVCTITTTSGTRQTSATASTATAKTSPATNAPVISNVVSLAPAVPRAPGPATIIRNIVPPKLVPSRQPMQPLAIIGSKTSTTTIPSAPCTVTNANGQQVLREVIVKPPAPKSQKNKSVACKPIMQNKGINVKPQPCHKAVQTDDSPRPILLPIPVPYYVPVPVHMFSRPVPCPLPFPVPMFVPIIVPPKDSSSQERSQSISGDKSLNKRIEEGLNSVKDKEGTSSQKENDDKCNDSVQTSFTMKIDEPSSSATSDECNDTNEYEEDEYVFKDSKSHHHGKRRAHHKSKGRKKSRTDDVIIEESKLHNTVSADENRNSSVENDHHEPVPRLKVP